MSVKKSVNSYFYTGDHLGSTSMVLDVDGNILQSVTYIPYGEVFVEERNGTWNSPTCSIPRKSLNNLYDFVFNSDSAVEERNPPCRVNYLSSSHKKNLKQLAP